MRALMLSMLFALTANTASASDLEAAYQKEYAYLKAERDALVERKADLQRESAQRTGEAQARVDALQAKLVALQTRVTTADEELSAAIRDADSNGEAREVVQSTLFQARNSLNNKALKIEDDASSEAATAMLDTAMGEMRGAIVSARSLRSEPGSFFLANGTKVDGTLTWIGDVAAFGTSDQGSGALLPLGDGTFKIHSEDASSTATAIAGGAKPERARIFVFENPKKRVEEAVEKGFGDWVAAGGVVGLVILGLGLIALLLVVVRTFALTLMKGGSSELDRVFGLLEAGKVEEARKAVANSRKSPTRVMHGILTAGDFDRQTLEDAAAEAILRETPRVERMNAAILVIAAVAPLLGLLGTVTGMIGTFEIITEFGTGDPKMLSGGISEALVTTQMGLIVAIPALLMGNLLNRMAEGVLSSMEASALAVINRVADTPENLVPFVGNEEKRANG